MTETKCDPCKFGIKGGYNECGYLCVADALTFMNCLTHLLKIIFESINLNQRKNQLLKNKLFIMWFGCLNCGYKPKEENKENYGVYDYDGGFELKELKTNKRRHCPECGNLMKLHFNNKEEK